MGKTKRGKGTKIIRWQWQTALVFLSPYASPHESKLVEQTIEARFIEEKPERLIGDKAYDSDALDEELKEVGIEMIAPHRDNRKSAPTQDGRALRRYKRRWTFEGLFAWLQNFRHLVVRYERYLENFLGFVYLGCIVILLRRYL